MIEVYARGKEGRVGREFCLQVGVMRDWGIGGGVLARCVVD